MTELIIRTAKATGGQRTEIWDKRVPGFGLRISPTGVKSFILVYRFGNQRRRRTIGRHPVVTLSEARKEALATLGQVVRKIDPRPSVSPQEVVKNFQEAVTEYVTTHCAQHNRARTRRQTERILRMQFGPAWNTRQIADLTKTDVLKVVDGVVRRGAPSQANHCLAIVRAFFNWCVGRGLVAQNPCEGLRAPAKKIARDRVLSESEVARVWITAESIGYPFGTIARLLLLTAQRRNEVASLEWPHLDFERCTWTIPADLSKTGMAHQVPLPTMAFTVLNEVPRVHARWLFPGPSMERPFTAFSRPKQNLSALAQVDNFTLHDFRRTTATMLASREVPPHVIERLLNHTTGVLGGVAGIYNRFKYASEVRAALQLWAGEIERLVAIQVASSSAVRC